MKSILHLPRDVLNEDSNFTRRELDTPATPTSKSTVASHPHLIRTSICDKYSCSMKSTLICRVISPKQITQLFSPHGTNRITQLPLPLTLSLTHTLSPSHPLSHTPSLPARPTPYTTSYPLTLSHIHSHSPHANRPCPQRIPPGVSAGPGRRHTGRIDEPIEYLSGTNWSNR